eukprot:gene2483-biopygen21550
MSIAARNTESGSTRGQSIAARTCSLAASLLRFARITAADLEHDREKLLELDASAVVVVRLSNHLVDFLLALVYPQGGEKELQLLPVDGAVTVLHNARVRATRPTGSENASWRSSARASRRSPCRCPLHEIARQRMKTGRTTEILSLESERALAFLRQIDRMGLAQGAAAAEAAPAPRPPPLPPQPHNTDGEAACSGAQQTPLAAPRPGCAQRLGAP